MTTTTIPTPTEASETFTTLAEGDIISVDQYATDLRVNFVRDVMVGVEFVDDTARDTQKNLYRHRETGRVTLVAGTTDKGEVDTIDVVSRADSDDEDDDEEDVDLDAEVQAESDALAQDYDDNDLGAEDDTEDEDDVDIAEGDVVTFAWTDDTRKRGVVESLWNDPDPVEEGDNASASVSVVSEEWPQGQTYDIALSWVVDIDRRRTTDATVADHSFIGVDGEGYLHHVDRKTRRVIRFDREGDVERVTDLTKRQAYLDHGLGNSVEEYVHDHVGETVGWTYRPHLTTRDVFGDPDSDAEADAVTEALTDGGTPEGDL